MATSKLTKSLIDSRAPTTADAYVWDSQLPRFGLRITQAGAKIYLIQYRARGAPGASAKTRRITIGKHGQPWTLDQARAEARRLLASVDLGQDPFEVRVADRQAKEDAKTSAEVRAAAEAAATHRRGRESYAALVDSYAKARRREGRAWEETERLLRFGLAPVDAAKRRSGRPYPSDTAGPMKAWGGLHIGDIRRSDVASLIDEISARSPAVARATYAALRPFFDWCCARDVMSSSPCDKLRAPPRPEARDRVLSDDELRLIWRGSDRLGYPFGQVVQLLMLTGQRRSEVAGIGRSELDLSALSWRIPAERTKNNKAHEIDLSPQALEVLLTVPNAGSFLFPARGAGAVRGFSATKRKLDELVNAVAIEVDAPPPAPWRLHDLRRTAATGMAALAFPPHVVERVLNHVSGAQSGLVGVYQRHEYRAERKAAIVAWGARVAEILENRPRESNVVALKG